MALRAARERTVHGPWAGGQGNLKSQEVNSYSCYNANEVVYCFSGCKAESETFYLFMSCKAEIAYEFSTNVHVCLEPRLLTRISHEQLLVMVIEEPLGRSGYDLFW